MKISLPHVLTAGLSVLTASALAVALTVQPPPPPRPAPTVQLTASVQPTALTPQQPLLTILLNSPLALLGPAAPLGTLPPAPAPQAIPIAPNLANTIDNVYLAVEPWVQYGFEVATAVVRWIPYAGWFAGLIMDGYFFGESIVASGVFNFTDWLRGDGSFVENLVDFGVDVGLAFVWLGLDALNTFIPLPPFCCYPPRPPVQGPFLALEESTFGEAATFGEETEDENLPDEQGLDGDLEQLDAELTDADLGDGEELADASKDLDLDEDLDDTLDKQLDEALEEDLEETDLDTTVVEDADKAEGTDVVDDGPALGDDTGLNPTEADTDTDTDTDTNTAEGAKPAE